MQILQSSLQQHSVKNTDDGNCTDDSEDIGVFGSQITTVAVIECTSNACNDEQLSDKCNTNMPLSIVESVSTAVCSSKVHSEEF